MRYYGGGVGHRGMGAPSLSTFDGEDPDPQWLDVIPDTAELDAEIPAAVEHAEDLIRLAVQDIASAEATAQNDAVLSDAMCAPPFPLPVVPPPPLFTPSLADGARQHAIPHPELAHVCI